METMIQYPEEGDGCVTTLIDPKAMVLFLLACRAGLDDSKACLSRKGHAEV